MKLGISSYTYTWAIGVPGKKPENPMNEIDLLQIAIANELEIVQIADNLPLNLFTHQRLQTLAQKAEQAGIKIETGSKGLTAEHLEEFIKISEMLQSHILRFVIDEEGYAPNIEDIVAIIRNAVPVLKSKNIVLAIENHDRLKAVEFEYIINKCASDNVGICLDSVNSLGAGEDVKRVTEMLAPFTVNFHVKEFVITRPQHKMGFLVTGCPLGQGMLPLEWMLKKLDDKVCKTAILEQWTAPDTFLQKTIEKEALWAKQSIEYWKTMVIPRNNWTAKK